MPLYGPLKALSEQEAQKAFPGRATIIRPVQIIDARDLAEWTIRCCEDRVYGVFNATGPASRFTVRQMLEGIRGALGAQATFVHATAAFLAAQQPPVRGWSDLPVWVPPAGETAGFTQRSIARALARA